MEIYILRYNENFSDNLLKKEFEKLPSWRKERGYNKSNIYSYLLLCHALKRNDFTFEYSESGKPFIRDSDIHFNISHSENVVVAGISKSEIGVDVESIRDHKESLYKRVCVESEIKKLKNTKEENKKALFTRFWCGKESFSKLTGVGMREILAGIDTLSLRNEGKIGIHEMENMVIAYASNDPMEIKTAKIIQVSSCLLP